ncbi:hypothetical protein BASA62_000474 [Batrachochytrium salamandrivorans]|nr:hypothetical protein BASA62_000474 [Batrachochytrium salamandrivorans]
MARAQRRSSAPSRAAPAPTRAPAPVSSTPATTQQSAVAAAPQQPSLFANMASTAAGVLSEVPLVTL